MMNEKKLLLNWTLPIKTMSEANCQEHWSKKHKRHKTQKLMIWAIFNQERPVIELPCIVKLTRIAPRTLDDDNLLSSVKWIRDEIASILTGNNIPGRADSDPRIKWHYGQEKGMPKEYSIRLEIFHS
jgi:hypothetical protein